MSDRFGASLKVRRADYEGDANLKKLLDQEKPDLEEYGTFMITDDQARYGEFDEIETYCVNHGIAFDRWSESYYEYRSQIRMFRPGATVIDKTVYLSSDNGDPFIECRTVRAILDDASKSESEKLQKIFEFIQNEDYPCKPIEEYRSPRESTEE